MSGELRIGAISDTHGLLRNEVYEAFDGVDEIVHAGDLGDPAILAELEVIAPVRAVYGNVDGSELRARLDASVEWQRLGQLLVVIHGHQFGSPRVADLVDAYPDATVIVYGHTHRPHLEWVEDTLVLNPGSAGPRRFDLPVSAGLITLCEGRRPQARLIDL